MNVSFICTGKTSEKYVLEGMGLYLERLKHYCKFDLLEVVIEAKDDNDDLFLNESADLLFHYLILLQAKGFKFENVVDVLKSRH